MDYEKELQTMKESEIHFVFMIEMEYKYYFMGCSPKLL